jgi:hypothetical protein
MIVATKMSFMSRTQAVSLWVGVRQCPMCGSDDVQRSHRRGLVDWIIVPVMMRPFRCRRCSGRHLGFFFRRRRDQQQSQSVVTE